MSPLAIISEGLDVSVSPGAAKSDSDIAVADLPPGVHAAVIVTVSSSTMTEVTKLVDDDGSSQLSNMQYFRLFLCLLLGTVIECEISFSTHTLPLPSFQIFESLMNRVRLQCICGPQLHHLPALLSSVRPTPAGGCERG